MSKPIYICNNCGCQIDESDDGECRGCGQSGDFSEASQDEEQKMGKNRLNQHYAEATGDAGMIEQAEQLSPGFLSGFTGTEKWYQVSRMNRTVCTDGAKHVADTASAWWFLDLIISWQTQAKVRQESFQTWKLEVWEDHSATVTATDGNENIIAKQEIPYTDFPVPEMTLWYVTGGLPTILLPSEY